MRIKEVLDFYKGSMPYCDKEDVSEAVLDAYARHALFLREKVEWCRQLPEDIFLENVAAYRINSERIEDCRRFFYDLVMPQLAGLSLHEAILRVNLWCAANATYHQADDRTANAVTVYKSGFGRCGEESTFAVTVLRSVGIAARQVYAPLWSHCDDNHAWVEVWCDGRWQYFGACEPEPVLNRGWFDLPASKAMLVHARAFGAARGQQEVIGRTGGVTYYNVTAHYGDTANVVFVCTDETGRPLAKTCVRLEILNYAHFGSIAALYTDESGRIAVRLGRGSLRLSCLKSAVYAERAKNQSACLQSGQNAAETEERSSKVLQEISALVRVEKSGELLVKLKAQERESWNALRFFAPKGSLRESKENDPEVFAAYQEKTEAARAQRERRISSYYDAERGGHYPEAEEILRAAAGNFKEVLRFLEKDDSPYRLKLLKVLTQKDYYDCKADMLEEHLEYALGYAGQAGVKDDIFVQYVLNPRLENEELSCWRRGLSEALAEKATQYRENPRLIWTDICEPLCPPTEDAYDTLRIQPLSAYRSGKAGSADQKNLFVAAARSLGIPARLHPETKEAEFYQGDAFCPVIVAAAGGTLTLLAEGKKGWSYWTDWCLEYLEADGYRPLQLSDKKWADGKLSLPLKRGSYRITTVVRLADGDQLGKTYCFEMGKEDRSIMLKRHEGAHDRDGKKLPPIKVCAQAGGAEPVSLQPGKRAACIWLREGEEPTEHILNELLERISDVKNVRERIFLLSHEAPRPAGTLQRLLRVAEGIGFYQPESFDTARQVAAAMGMEQSKYPLAVSIDEAGRGIYATCGYNVGSVAQLLLRL